MNPRRIVGVAAAVVFLGTAPASARVIQAETILPPGQSGFVGPDGSAARTGRHGDAPAREQLRGALHRVRLLQSLVAAAAKKPSSFDAGTTDILRSLASIATQRPAAQKILEHAAKGVTGPAADVLQALLAWDGNFTQTAEDGTLEPGVAIWQAFKAAAEDVMFGKLSPSLEGLFETPRS